MFVQKNTKFTQLDLLQDFNNDLKRFIGNQKQKVSSSERLVAEIHKERGATDRERERERLGRERERLRCDAERDSPNVMMIITHGH